MSGDDRKLLEIISIVGGFHTGKPKIIRCQIVFTNFTSSWYNFLWTLVWHHFDWSKWRMVSIMPEMIFSILVRAGNESMSNRWKHQFVKLEQVKSSGKFNQFTIKFRYDRIMFWDRKRGQVNVINKNCFIEIYIFSSVIQQIDRT